MEPPSQVPPAGGLGAPGASPPLGPSLSPAPPRSNKGMVAIVVVVSVGAIIFVVGILAVLAIYGVRKYIASAKTAEAQYMLGRIGRQAVAAYEADWVKGTVGSMGAEPVSAHRLCPSARPIPEDYLDVRARKYQSRPEEWTNDRGWSCLKFEIDAPQYYQYRYDSDARSFTATATGDLDGDGIRSTFELTGRVENDFLVIAPSLRETNPAE